MTRIRIAALLAAIALIPAAAEAQTTITACYVPKTGSVYRIEATGAPVACKNGHVEFSWTTPAVSYGPITTVSASLTLAPYAEGSKAVDCPAGSVALSGGYLNGGLILPSLTVMMNGRNPQTGGWFVYAKNLSDAHSATLTVQAYCATITQ
jgi:hypothetical protein